MPMSRYETLILTTPEITRSEMTDLEEQFEKTIKNQEGSMLSFERWGKYRLAYSVNNNDYGVYFLSRFEVKAEKSGQLVKDIKLLFEVKFPLLVMRSITVALSHEQSLSYYKPESLEEAPVQDVDSFIRENKMEGLLSAIPSKSGRGKSKTHEDTHSADMTEEA